jgi:RNA polymerase sigma factor (sigma-70 family)
MTSAHGRGDIADLVQRARDRDRAALEELLAAVQDDVHRLTLRMTGCPDDALDATQEILVRVMTRISTFKGEAAFGTWVHRIAVNHLLDRKRSAVERLELTFSRFADELLDGLAPVAPNAGPELDVLAREVKHGCTLALLTCLDRPLRVSYVLGEVFGVSSSEGAWICDTTETAYRKRLPAPARWYGTSSPSIAVSSPRPPLAVTAASGSRPRSRSAASTPTPHTIRPRRPSTLRWRRWSPSTTRPGSSGASRTRPPPTRSPSGSGR